jgi:hypothetical protein
MKRKGLLWFAVLEVLLCESVDSFLLGLWWGLGACWGVYGTAYTSWLGGKKTRGKKELGGPTMPFGNIPPTT